MTAKKCTKKRDARAKLLFRFSNLLLLWSSRCRRRRRILRSLLLFYRSDFIFLKILLLWSAPAQSKSQRSKQRFRLYIVLNIDFLSLERFRECKFECKLLSLRLAETFLKSVFGWVIGHEQKLLATSSLKKSTCRQILGWQ